MDKEQVLFLAEILDKTAEYIESLESQVAELEAKIVDTSPAPEVEKQAEINEKLANIGFTKEEIQAMDSLPQELMDKVANVVNDSKPWGLGQGVGVQRDKTDPLLEFLLS